MASSTLPRDYDIGRMLADYERRIAYLERRLLQTQAAIPDTGWVDLTLLNGWTSVAGGTAQVRLIGIEVLIRGRIIGGSSQTIAILDSIFRPTVQDGRTIGYNYDGAEGRLITARVSDGILQGPGGNPQMGLTGGWTTD